MIFKNQISQILAINNKVNDSTIRFDKGSPSPQLFSLKESIFKELEKNIIKHPINLYEPLLDEIIKIENKTSKWVLQKDQITFTNGVLSGLFFVLSMLLNKGDRVIINELCFEGITSLLNTLQLKPVAMDYENKLQLEKNIQESYAKVLILNSPENPSGKIYDKGFLIFLNYLVKKYNLLIISDEVNNQKIYAPFKFIPPCQYILQNNLVVLNSFTKNYFLPGIRLGWVIAKPQIIKNINNLSAVSQVGINYPSQIITSYVIENFSKQIEDYKQILLYKKLFMEKVLQKNKLNYMNPVMAGTVFFVNVNQDSRKFSELLLKKYNIATVPGILFGIKWNEWLRLGFGAVSREEIVKGLKIISMLWPRSR